MILIAHLLQKSYRIDKSVILIAHLLQKSYHIDKSMILIAHLLQKFPGFLTAVDVALEERLRVWLLRVELASCMAQSTVQLKLQHRAHEVPETPPYELSYCLMLDLNMHVYWMSAQQVYGITHFGTKYSLKDTDRRRK